MKFLLRLYKDKKIVRRVQTMQVRKFAQILASLKDKLTGEKGYLAYIKVNYGRDSYNDGEYSIFTELHKAFRAFIEDDGYSAL